MVLPFLFRLHYLHASRAKLNAINNLPIMWEDFLGSSSDRRKEPVQILTTSSHCLKLTTSSHYLILNTSSYVILKYILRYFMLNTSSHVILRNIFLFYTEHILSCYTEKHRLLFYTEDILSYYTEKHLLNYLILNTSSNCLILNTSYNYCVWVISTWLNFRAYSFLDASR